MAIGLKPVAVFHFPAKINFLSEKSSSTLHVTVKFRRIAPRTFFFARVWTFANVATGNFDNISAAEMGETDRAIEMVAGCYIKG